MKAVARIFIRRTPEDVFAFATAWPNYQKWQEGGTDATYTFDAELTGFMMLGQPLLRWVAERRIARDYDRLKALLERGGDA
jgi:hypothetical protein